MTPANPDALADAPYVLLKRGLFERPGHHGYTGVLRHAGRFSYEEASASAVHGGSVTMMLASEAPVYSPACWHETQVEDLLDLLRIEREAKAAAEARAAQLQAERDEAVNKANEEETSAVWDKAMRRIAENESARLRDRAAQLQAEVEALTAGFEQVMAMSARDFVSFRRNRTALAARAATAREG